MKLLPVLLFIIVLMMPVATLAQEPTPTPSVIHGDDGDFVIVPEISFGDGGVIVGLIVLCGVELLRVAMEISEWSRQ